jgi:hypothetical protein
MVCGIAIRAASALRPPPPHAITAAAHGTAAARAMRPRDIRISYQISG